MITPAYLILLAEVASTKQHAGLLIMGYSVMSVTCCGKCFMPRGDTRDPFSCSIMPVSVLLVLVFDICMRQDSTAHVSNVGHAQ